jgi:hypothetical protein
LHKSLRAGLIFFLLALIGLLGYLNLDTLQTEVDVSPILTPNSVTLADARLDAGKLAPPPTRKLSEFSQTTARPLFSFNRRAIERKPQISVETTKPQAPSFPPEQLQLVGIIKGDSQRALIRVNGTAQGKWISLGEDIEGWRLLEVADNAAVLATKGQRYELHLSQKPQP